MYLFMLTGIDWQKRIETKYIGIPDFCFPWQQHRVGDKLICKSKTCRLAGIDRENYISDRFLSTFGIL